MFPFLFRPNSFNVFLNYPSLRLLDFILYRDTPIRTNEIYSDPSNSDVLEGWLRFLTNDDETA